MLFILFYFWIGQCYIIRILINSTILFVPELAITVVKIQSRRSIGDKINRQTDRHNNSLLDRINKKLESLEIVERSITNTKVERKNGSFLGLLEKMNALNSKLEKEREFEPHHRSPLAKTMIDNWHNRQKNNLVSTNISINMTYITIVKKIA